MYRIKPKKGYNVVLKDMGLVLRTEKDEWIEVDEELFNNSNDAKRLKKLIIIEGQKNETGKAEKVKDVQPKSKQDSVYAVPENAFVVGTRTYKNPDDVFVKTQNDIVDPITQVAETPVEPVKEDVKVETEKVEKTVTKTETVKEPEVKVKSEKVEKTTKTEKTKTKGTDAVEDNKSKEENTKKESKKNKK